MASVDVAAEGTLARYASAVAAAAEAALRLLGEDASELSIALVDDEAIRKLNAAWRDKDTPTDVLAFPQREGEGPEVPGLLGDVVISIPTAERQAAERGHTIEHEIRELLVHGILHVLGFDHERSAADAERMFARQREVLAAIEAGESGR